MNKKIMTYILFGVLGMNILLFVPLNAQAQNVKDCLEQNENCLEDDEEEEGTSENNEPITSPVSGTSLGFNIVKMIFALILIVVLIIFISKFFGRKTNRLQQLNMMENMGGMSLGQNKSVQVIRLGTSFYIVGVADNIQLLKEITDPEIIEQLLQSDGEDSNISSVFQQFFNRNQRKQESNDEQETKNEDSFVSLLSSELQKIQRDRANMINENKKKDD